MGAVAIDSRSYGRVLARALPRIVENEREHERALREIESLAEFFKVSADLFI